MNPTENLKVALVQSDLHWQEKGANLAMFEEKISGLKGKADLIVLPEMFTTGFSMEAQKLAEPMNLHTHKWMLQMAAHTGAALTGSFIVSEGGRCYNRMLWAAPDGSFDWYDKKHLFRMAGEDSAYTAGNKRVIKTLKGWKILLQVCYDLRFPVWARNAWSAEKGLAYDAIVYVANWPERRAEAWRALLKARAIENLSYVAGVNRTGTDGNGIVYSGDTSLFGPDGKELYHAGNSQAANILEMEAEALNGFREKFPAYLDADGFDFQGL